MEIEQVVRTQYRVTFDESEARNIRAYLEGLQEGDYELPFKRNHVGHDQQADTIKAMGDLREALRSSVHSGTDIDHL